MSNLIVEDFMPRLTIDFGLLREQKAALLNLLNQDRTHPEKDALEGVISLIEGIQDCAIDDYEFNPCDVLNLSKEDNTEEN